MKDARGFTLIELMIAVAIISILVALGLPVYQDYIVRSQVAEGLTLAQGAKTGITEHYSARGTFPANNNAAGLAPPASIKGRYVSSVEVGNNTGEITVSFGGSAGTTVSGQQMLLQATDTGGSLGWRCSSASIDPRYLPPSCR